MNTSTSATRSLLTLTLATALVGAGAGMAQAKPAKSRDVTCTSTISRTTIKGDVLVPEGATCTLSRVKVNGNVKAVRGVVNLKNTQVMGNVTTSAFVPSGGGPGGRAGVNLVNSTVRGLTTIGTATTASLKNSTVQAMNVDGGYYWATVTITDSRVNGPYTGDGRTNLKVNDSVFRRSLKSLGVTRLTAVTVRGNTVADGRSATICGSRLVNVHATGSPFTTLGDGKKCRGNVIRGDLDLKDSVIAVFLYGNTVHGDVTGPEADTHVEGRGNRFLGEYPAQFEGLQ